MNPVVSALILTVVVGLALSSGDYAAGGGGGTTGGGNSGGGKNFGGNSGGGSMGRGNNGGGFGQGGRFGSGVGGGVRGGVGGRVGGGVGGKVGGSIGGGSGSGFSRVNFDYKGDYGPWGPYGVCSVACGGGTQFRSRECIKPKFKFLGSFLGCDGASSEFRSCNTHSCAVNGMWSAWSAFGTCSAPCGGGSKGRWRTCTNPAPSNGGMPCAGAAEESMACNTQGCAVNGMWSAWSAFGTCSAPCGGGSKGRWRTCTNPAPSNGGMPCAGAAEESMACNTQGCAVNGMWSNWGPFSACSKPCGGGTKRRDRSCNNPAPSNNGAYCIGSGWESMDCNKHRCSHY